MGKQGVASSTPPTTVIDQLVGLFNSGRHAELEGRARQLVEQYPDFATGWLLLGGAMHMQGKDGLSTLRQTAKRFPDDGDVHNNLGNVLMDKELLDEAAASYRRALALRPDMVVAHYNLGTVLKELGDLKEAVACCRRALELNPKLPEVHVNLGNFLKDSGQLDAALQSYRQALKLAPNNFTARSNMLFVMNYSAHSSLKPQASLEHCVNEAREYGRIVSEQTGTPHRTWTCEPQPERLKVGIVSADLHNHPVGYFLESMLPHFDPKRIELIAYPTNIKRDELTERIKPHFSKWRELNSLDDAAAAQSIRADGIHILLDLIGHTGKNRLPMFANKPAPVQAMWLGYFATTGLAEMDYVLGDRIVMPESEAHHFVEKRWRLDGAISCMMPPSEAISVAALPALSNQYVTFGTLNNLAKMNDQVVACWARILNAVPESRLYMNTGALRDQEFRDNVAARYAEHGIDASRLVMAATTGRANALASYAKFDIALDPFPYPGWTTTYEALWMGVPTVAIRGEAYISHLGESIMHHAGLPDWVADDEEDYVAKAVAFASDVEGLASLRAGLRDQVLNSPLFDAPRFARDFEQALWGMWQARDNLL